MGLLEGPSGQQEETWYIVINGRWFRAEEAEFPKGAGAQWVRGTAGLGPGGHVIPRQGV